MLADGFAPRRLFFISRRECRFTDELFSLTACVVRFLRIAIGFIVVALFSIYRTAALHIVFIIGFNLIVFTVAIRVVFGHSGKAHFFQRRLPFFIATILLLFFAMLSRVSADLAPSMRTPHLVAAAICWLAAALIWIIRVIPKVIVVEAKEE